MYFMYLVFTRMPGGVTVDDSGLFVFVSLFFERCYFPLLVTLFVGCVCLFFSAFCYKVNSDTIFQSDVNILNINNEVYAYH